MKRELLQVDASELAAVLLPRLREKMFHLTSDAGFRGICEAGGILGNADRRFPLTLPQSDVSYGRKRGYVRLFDLRGVDDEGVDEVQISFPARDEVGGKEMFLWRFATWFPGKLPLERIETVLEVELSDQT